MYEDQEQVKQDCVSDSLQGPEGDSSSLEAVLEDAEEDELPDGFLTMDEERALLARYIDGDMEAHETLTLAFEPLALSMAKKYLQGATIGEDIQQEVYCGVLEALARYNKERSPNGLVRAYIKLWAKSYVSKYVDLFVNPWFRRQRCKYDQGKEMRSVMQDCRKNGVKPTPAVLKKLLTDGHWNDKRVDDVYEAVNLPQVVCLDAPTSHDGDGVMFGEYIPDEGPSYYDRRDEDEVRMWARNAVHKPGLLTDQERDFFVRNTWGGKNYRQISAEVGVSKQRVSQVCLNARKKLVYEYSMQNS
jgi:RNA polymerase sigma factor (sigma-70 family)